MLLAVLNQWLAQFVIVYSTPYMISNLSYGTFFLFGSFTLISAGICYCIMPETKGFALEDMHFIFENGHQWAITARKTGERLRDERNSAQAMELVLRKDDVETHHCENIGSNGYKVT